MKNVSASCCQQLHIFTAIPVLSNSTTSRSPCLGTKQMMNCSLKKKKFAHIFNLAVNKIYKIICVVKFPARKQLRQCPSSSSTARQHHHQKARLLQYLANNKSPDAWKVSIDKLKKTQEIEFPLLLWHLKLLELALIPEDNKNITKTLSRVIKVRQLFTHKMNKYIFRWRESGCHRWLCKKGKQESKE